jgi:Fe2+ or Zn2+ uptake regulation protein
MDIIRQGRGHLDADEIFRRAREKEPRLSLSTVYRTLQMMKELHLVYELHFAEDHHHYEEKPAKEHYHFICLDCGRVVEFSYPLPRLLKREVAAVRDFDVSETEIRIAGYCDKCRQARRNASLSER